MQYLTKKHLKKNSFENFLRYVLDRIFELADKASVVATSKDTYSLRYFKVDQDDVDDEE